MFRRILYSPSCCQFIAVLNSHYDRKGKNKKCSKSEHMSRFRRDYMISAAEICTHRAPAFSYVSRKKRHHVYFILLHIENYPQKC